MSIAAKENGANWPPGRWAAAFLFVVGVYWAFVYASDSESVIPKNRLFVVPGYAVWLCWGIRALGFRQTAFKRLVWRISFFWHLLWFFVLVWLFPAWPLITLLAPLQILWTLVAFALSWGFWTAKQESQ